MQIVKKNLSNALIFSNVFAGSTLQSLKGNEGVTNTSMIFAQCYKCSYNSDPGNNKADNHYDFSVSNLQPLVRSTNRHKSFQWNNPA